MVGCGRAKMEPFVVLEFFLCFISVILKECGRGHSLKTGENIRTIWAQKLKNLKTAT